MKAAPEVGRLRGKTHAGRLQMLEEVIDHLWGELLCHGAVDIGVGEDPVTVVEWATRLGSVTAVEAHPRRAAAAQELPGVTVVQADALDGGPGTAGVVRCANVLRQYPTAQVPHAHAALVSWVVDGGAVLEGSCDAQGHVGAFHGLRRRGASVERACLVFVTDFARGFAPIQLRDQLPRDLRRAVTPKTAIGTFFSRWMAAWRDGRVGDPRTDFDRAATALHDCGLLHLTKGRRALVWRPDGGVPLASAPG